MGGERPMADEFPRDRPHLFINGGGAVEPYRRPNQAMNTSALPPRDRAGHAAAPGRRAFTSKWWCRRASGR
jgi:hypothetical protein